MNTAIHLSSIRMQQSASHLSLARTQQIKASSDWWFLRNKSLVRRNNKHATICGRTASTAAAADAGAGGAAPSDNIVRVEEGVDKVELWWQWSKSHVSGKLFGTLTNGTTTTYDATTGRQVTSMTNPSDGDDDTIPTTMITDTTINWFWPRIAVLVPIITINGILIRAPSIDMLALSCPCFTSVKLPALRDSLHHTFS